MTRTQGFVLSAVVAHKLVDQALGALTPVLSVEKARQDVQLLDTFDEEVAASGQLLVETPDTAQFIPNR